MPVGVDEGVCVKEGVDVLLELDESVLVGVLEVEGVAELLGVSVIEGDVVALGVCVKELLELRVADDDDELESDAVREAEPELLLVIEGDGDEDTLRMDAMLRPRKVMLDTAASASPDSHSVERSTPLDMVLLGMSCVILISR